MVWNYRVVRKTNRLKATKKVVHFYDLHEVYYSKRGDKYVPDSWTEDAILGGFDSVNDLECSLARMLLDVLKSPVGLIKGKGKKQVFVNRDSKKEPL